ncbi:hypothetical protein Taro_011095 [Colocasia esculenta]|uniref:Uncharacterized protein n=1 Tax=Colocasia esculenta TaxID=4460 RepID=A0A843UA06_COLES|nr:hypothetical protein [Colocasia esculenta]
MALPLRGGCWPPLAVALLLLFLCLARASGETEPAGLGEPSAPERAVREALRAHGLPIGLLPRGAREFRIDGEGHFEVRLDGACSARFENEVRYEANVTGTLTYGQIGALSGVTAQELFLWFPVKGISVEDPSSGLIFFDVGVVRKQFPLSLFEIPPDCKVGPPPANLNEVREMVQAVEKSKSGKLRYHLDQDAAQRTATL